MPIDSANFTVLLRRWASGDRTVENDLFEIAYPKLRQIARQLLRRERDGHSLESIDLVNQIYPRLCKAAEQDWRGRQHFFALTARMMRHYLIDLGRARPDAQFMPIEDWDPPVANRNSMNLAILVDKLLKELETEQPEWCTIVELKFFLGLTDKAAAEVMGLTERTMQRKWLDAKLWLYERLERQSVKRSAARQ